MAEVTREWHKIEFLSPGVLHDDTDPAKGYKPAERLGHGYYVVENGHVVAQVDEQGAALDMTRLHECKIVQVLTVSPFAAPEAP
jgi:hypothetical protein